MDSNLASILITNAGIAGIVIVLIITGYLVPKSYYTKLDEENTHLKEALRLERQRANEVTASAAITNHLIGALTDLAAEKHPHHEDNPEPARGDSLLCCTCTCICACSGIGAGTLTSGYRPPSRKRNSPARHWKTPAKTPPASRTSRGETTSLTLSAPH